MQFTLNRQLMAMDLYQRFTQPKTEKTLQRQVIAARTTLANEDLRLQRQVDRLATLNEAGRVTARFAHLTMASCITTRTPTARRSQTVIEEGMAVRQRQELFYLPDLSELEVQMALNESVVNRVSAGMKAKVRFEALPDLELDGEVVDRRPVSRQRQAEMEKTFATSWVASSSTKPLPALHPACPRESTSTCPGETTSSPFRSKRSGPRRAIRSVTSPTRKTSRSARSNLARRQRRWSKSPPGSTRANWSSSTPLHQVPTWIPFGIQPKTIRANRPIRRPSLRPSIDLPPSPRINRADRSYPRIRLSFRSVDSCISPAAIVHECVHAKPAKTGLPLPLCNYCFTIVRYRDEPQVQFDACRRTKCPLRSARECVCARENPEQSGCSPRPNSPPVRRHAVETDGSRPATRIVPKTLPRSQFMQKRAKFIGTRIRCVLLIVLCAAFAVGTFARRAVSHARTLSPSERYFTTGVKRTDLFPTLTASGRVESSKRTIIECDLENVAVGVRGQGVSAGGASVLLSVDTGRNDRQTR